MWLVFARAHAQGTADELPLTDRELPLADIDDPIGLRQEDTELDRGPAPQATPDAQAFGPKPPALSARRGDVLTAPASVRQTQHRVNIQWRAGLALVRNELAFTSSATRNVTHTAEVTYRLSVPAHATLVSLQVCLPAGCRDGVADPNEPISAYDDAVQARGLSSGLPVAHARIVVDERGDAIVLRAAPIRAEQTLIVRVTFMVEAPVRGGVVRLSLPPRGLDERASDAEVTLDAPDLVSVSLADAPITPAPVLLEPWRAIEVVGRLAATSRTVSHHLRYRCGDGECTRVWLAAPAAPLLEPDVALVLDASPSMRGPARGRLGPAISALLALLPQERPIDVVAFAANARLLQQATPPSAITLTPLIDASHGEDLGSGTRFQAAWDALTTWQQRTARPRRSRQIVVLGDGSISRHQQAVFRHAARAGITISWVNLSDRETDPELRDWVESTRGITIDAGRIVATTASASASTASNADVGAFESRLEEALSELFAVPVLGAVLAHRPGHDSKQSINIGTLRAGSQRVWSGLAERVRVLAIEDDPHRFELQAKRPLAVAVASPLEAGLNRSADSGGALSAVDPADVSRAGSGRPRPAPQCDPRGPAQRQSGISSDLDPVSLSEARSCRVNTPAMASHATANTSGHGMPASPLLTMLRQRILPVARGCFRRDRAGRAEYELRATFDLELSNQEVTDAQVTGDVPEPLRTCLLEAASRLDIPYFTGVVRARYPLRTQTEPLPEEIELSPGIASDLDRLLDDHRGALHTPPAF